MHIVHIYDDDGNHKGAALFDSKESMKRLLTADFGPQPELKPRKFDTEKDEPE